MKSDRIVVRWMFLTASIAAVLLFAASAQAATKACRAADARHRPKEAALVRPRMGTSSVKVLPKASGTPWGLEPVLRACRLLHVATRTPVSERSRKTFSYSESAWSVGLRSAWIS